jgi:hypothetical protein
VHRVFRHVAGDIESTNKVKHYTITPPKEGLGRAPLGLFIMKKIYIDSGVNSGVATFQGHWLVSADLDTNYNVLYKADRLVYELPIAHSEGRSKCDPNKLIKLAVLAGRLTAGTSWECVEQIYPITWKGNVPDQILYTRILNKLSLAERMVIPKLPKSKLHNVLDAVGIGLYDLGRMGQGGT